MKYDLELCKSIGFLILFISVLFIVTLLALSQFESSIYDECCKNQTGTLIFYECQNPPIFSNGTKCSDLKTGYYCNIKGKEIKADKLDCIVNITNAES